MFYYKYSHIKKKCWLINSKEIAELSILSQTFSKIIFQHSEATLTIELWSEYLFTAFLRTKKKIETVSLKNINNKIIPWKDTDGVFQYNEKMKGYQLMPRKDYSFFLYYDKFNWRQETFFYFNYWTHLVQKDKDGEKPYFWYQNDWYPTLTNYIYELTKENIKTGTIVAIPSERNQVLVPWRLNGYKTNGKYDYIYKGSKEWYLNEYTTEKWLLENKTLPSLVLSYLPPNTNPKLTLKERATGTRWFKKIWEIFGEHNVPIVLKCYPNFIHRLIPSSYPEIFKKLNMISILPLSISGREIGMASYIAFFNCPFLSQDGKVKKIRAIFKDEDGTIWQNINIP